jgi:trehalose/maltose hydrolase-like predicted phosphorylase
VSLTHNMHGKDWIVEQRGLDPDEHRYWETTFTLANGVIGTRGSLEEHRETETSSPATLVAGLFDRHPARYAVPELVNVPNWAVVRVHDGHGWIGGESGRWLSHTRRLDMRRGVLEREGRWESARGRVTRITITRFVSRVEHDLCALRCEVTPENYGGKIAISSAIDGAVSNHGRRLTEPVRMRATREGIEFDGVTRYRRKGFGITATHTLGVRTGVLGDRPRPLPRGAVKITPRKSGSRIETAHAFRAEARRTYVYDKLASVRVQRDRDAEGSDRKKSGGRRFEDLLLDHIEAWAAAWAEADVRFHGDAATQKAMRFALFHLMQCATQHNIGLHASIAAKGLHGLGYKGHVFWDTEIFMLPFFTADSPDVAKALLMYRYNTLAGARANALKNGFAGAQFPWECAGTADEATPEWLFLPRTKWIDGLRPDIKGRTRLRIWCGEMQHHVVADVAFGFWTHWRWTGDDAFMRDCGAEVLIETARFWASRVTETKPGRYEIHRVIGPDEDHEGDGRGVDNNIYTNVMARWNLGTASDIADWLRTTWPGPARALRRKLSLSDGEIARWREIANGIVVRFDPKTKLYPQFDGYFDLPKAIRSNQTFATQGKTRWIKQPDVLMTLGLFPELATPAIWRANFDLYEPATTHRSSLSPAVHAVYALRAGRTAKAYRYLKRGLGIDYGNIGANNDGIHAASLGGAWQAAVFGFGGVGLDGDTLVIEPDLSAPWRSLDFRIHYRGVPIRVRCVARASRPCETRAGRSRARTTETDEDEIVIALIDRAASDPTAEPLSIAAWGRSLEARPGHTYVVPRGRGEIEDLCDPAILSGRRHRMIVFDWDGTAVPDRRSPIGRLKGAVEEAVRRGAILAVVTGTHMGNVDSQFTHYIDRSLRHGIIVGCNRGAQVFGFDKRGQMVTLYEQKATRRENEQMDRVAADVCSMVRERGVNAAIIADRMNRRKVDLIPDREFDKHEIGECLRIVERRLRRAGFAGGIRDVFRAAVRKSIEIGLPHMRVTTDVKHIEFGLSNKADSVRYMMNVIARMHRIRKSEIVFGGDEYGEIGGFGGSDSMMMEPDETMGCVFFSVGKEPNGVPPGVIHVGGGPARFAKFIDTMAR